MDILAKPHDSPVLNGQSLPVLASLSRSTRCDHTLPQQPTDFLMIVHLPQTAESAIVERLTPGGFRVGKCVEDEFTPRACGVDSKPSVPRA